MEYRQIGDSNLKVSVIGLGGNIFGHFTNFEETKKIIDFALENGINFIDTANVYSNGLSEEYIGRAIEGKRDKIIIATKAGLQSYETPENKFTYDYIIKSVDESLKKLKTNYIDLYQVHSYDLSVPLNETMRALNELIEAGKVRYIGCSNYTLNNLKEAISTEHKHRFISLQNKYNLFERDLEKEIFSFCEKQKIGILVYGALARGLLTGKYKKGANLPEHFRANNNLKLRSQLTDQFFTTSTRLEQFSKRFNTSINNLALSWLLSKPIVSSVIVGIRSVEQLNSNLESLNVKLNTKDLKEIDLLLNNFKLN